MACRLASIVVMKKEIAPEHKLQFEEMRKKLALIGYKEMNFLKIELLFYEAMEIARGYGNDCAENDLLNALKKLQANEYANTKALFKKSAQREQVIGRFISQFKVLLAAAIKNAYFSGPEPAPNRR
jgi:hypothetical protein